MNRRIQLPASLLGLTSVAGLWGFALFVSITDDKHAGYALGYAHGESWLLGAVVYPDGHVLAAFYDQNLTLHDGFYAKLSRANARHDLTLAALIPHRFRRGPFSPASGVTFHLGLPLLVFLIWSGFLILYPILRARVRRKRGLCVTCAYDLTGNVSGKCSECGKPMETKASG